MFIPLAAVPSGERATRPACVIFCSSVLPSGVCCSSPACVIRAPFGSSIIPPSVCHPLSLPLSFSTLLRVRVRVTARCYCGNSEVCARSLALRHCGCTFYEPGAKVSRSVQCPRCHG
uniref:Putative secreted peptide n=1 Tax=Anopheles braziliensis TaxID=58242 RepID=A0A2M3ZMI5_9DIPT